MSEWSRIAEPLAKGINYFVSAYIGSNYEKELPAIWRVVNASIGASFAIFGLISVSITTANNLQLSRLQAAGWLPYILMGFVMAGYFGIIVGKSVCGGGPLRLFLFGVGAALLPLIAISRVFVQWQGG